MEEFKNRKTPRLQGFDYNSVGAYFITICTANRRCILYRVVGTGVLDCPKIELTKYGEIAEKYIKQLDDFYDNLSIESYVIMPNHIHLILFINENGQAEYTMEPEIFAKHMMTLTEAGADVIGGCCGTNPEYIRQVKNLLKNL